MQQRTFYRRLGLKRTKNVKFRYRVAESEIFVWSRTLGVRIGFFCPTPTPDVQSEHFYITLLSWEFLLKWYNFFLNFCWNRGFLLCTTISIDFNSQISFPLWYVKESKSEILERLESESDVLLPTPQPIQSTSAVSSCICLTTIYAYQQATTMHFQCFTRRLATKITTQKKANLSTTSTLFQAITLKRWKRWNQTKNSRLTVTTKVPKLIHITGSCWVVTKKIRGEDTEASGSMCSCTKFRTVLKLLSQLYLCWRRTRLRYMVYSLSPKLLLHIYLRSSLFYRN